MSAVLRAKVAVARLSGRAARAAGRGGTSLPGKVLLRLDRDVVAHLAADLPAGCAAISATNGKTTTAALVAAVLELDGRTLVHNRSGANMEGGVAASLMAARRGRRAGGDLGLFEVDEMWLPGLVPKLHPRAILLANLFRDQLDRYGELETIATRWAAMTASLEGTGTRLVLGADDPAVADLGLARGRAAALAEGAAGGEASAVGADADAARAADPEVLYFGVEDRSVALDERQHASDAGSCRVCGAAYAYAASFVGHLGHWRCPRCGHARPRPAVAATRVRLLGARGAEVTIRLPADPAPDGTPAPAGAPPVQIEVPLALPGLYNVYNAVGAAALCHALGVPAATIARGLQVTDAAFGRAERLRIAERDLTLLLVKNPAGANEVFRTLALDPEPVDLLALLNDRIADGRDVSWIWDADVEALAGRVRTATCGGTRAPEMALRLKYAGVPEDRIRVVEDGPGAALDVALQRAGPALAAVPTYTAMLELREELVRRGAAVGSFA